MGYFVFAILWRLWRSSGRLMRYLVGPALWTQLAFCAAFRSRWVAPGGARLCLRGRSSGTVAILAQGTSWAVAVTQAYFLAARPEPTAAAVNTQRDIAQGPRAADSPKVTASALDSESSDRGSNPRGASTLRTAIAAGAPRPAA